MFRLTFPFDPDQGMLVPFQADPTAEPQGQETVAPFSDLWGAETPASHAVRSAVCACGQSEFHFFS